MQMHRTVKQVHVQCSTLQKYANFWLYLPISLKKTLSSLIRVQLILSSSWTFSEKRCQNVF